MLQGLGLEVIGVATGDDAVRRALSDTVQLVLMDRHLPGLDGVEATRLLRQAGFRRPIVAFTAGDQPENEAMLVAGCDGVLSKPIDRSHLLAILRKHFAEHAKVPEVAGDDFYDAGMDHLVVQFLDGLDARKETLVTAAESRNRDELKFEAHLIKGTAGAMGYPEMTRQAARLEACLKAETLDWAEVLAALEPLVGVIDRALKGNEQ
jgi:CheY-like chemotaxis protein